MLEISDGTIRSQVNATNYSFGTQNDVNQLVGKAGAAVLLAPRGTAVADEFVVEIPLNTVTPGLLNAIVRKIVIPEIKIVENGTVQINDVPQIRPVREWTLTNVLVEQLSGGATSTLPAGSFRLQLNPAAAASNRISYSLTGTAMNAIRTIDFVTPPVVLPLGLITGISTGADRVIDIPSRFVDQEASSTLRYTVAVVSGANLFDSVTLNSINRLILNYKADQSGLAQLRVDATDSFGLISSLLVNVAVDLDGLTGAPAGTNLTVVTNEDTTYTIKADDFGFTDPFDVPANIFTAVRVTSLPSKGSLTLNNVPGHAGSVDRGNRHQCRTAQIRASGQRQRQPLLVVPVPGSGR